MVENRSSGRRRASGPSVAACAQTSHTPRRFAGLGRYAGTPSTAPLTQAMANLAEARAVGVSLLALNPESAAPAAAPARSRRDALAAERQTTLVAVAPLTRREVREMTPAPRRRNRFIATLPHQAAAAAAATGLVAAAVWPQAVADEGNKPTLEADLAAVSSAAPAKDVVAGDGEAQLQIAAVTARAGAASQFEILSKETGGDFSKLTPAESAGVLAQPLSNVRITSPFGVRADPWGGGGTVGHIGMDYGVQCGTPVKVAAAGTVVQAESAGHSGLRVRVDHGGGLQTTYNHNSALKVKVGDVLERGDVVSLSGTTGNSTGCHLHFEVLVNDEPVNPADWV